MREISEAPHYAVFSSLPQFLPLKSKYSPQHPVIKHSQFHNHRERKPTYLNK